MTLMGEIGSCENFVNCYPVVAPGVQAGIRHSDVQMGCRRMACNLSTNELLYLGLHEVFWDDVAARL